MGTAVTEQEMVKKNAMAPMVCMHEKPVSQHEQPINVPNYAQWGHATVVEIPTNV
jgi:hypothetical protein